MAKWRASSNSPAGTWQVVRASGGAEGSDAHRYTLQVRALRTDLMSPVDSCEPYRLNYRF